MFYLLVIDKLHPAKLPFRRHSLFKGTLALPLGFDGVPWIAQAPLCTQMLKKLAVLSHTNVTSSMCISAAKLNSWSSFNSSPSQSDNMSSIAFSFCCQNNSCSVMCWPNASAKAHYFKLSVHCSVRLRNDSWNSYNSQTKSRVI